MEVPGRHVKVVKSIIAAASLAIPAALLFWGGSLYFHSGEEAVETRLFAELETETPRHPDKVDRFDVAVGIGWAMGEPETAVESALAMAMKGMEDTPPDCIIIHPTAGSHTREILEKLRRLTGSSTRFFGGTSDARGIFAGPDFVTGSSRGYSDALPEIEQGYHALAMMVINTPLIRFGVGGARLEDHDSRQSTARAALEMAIADATKNACEKPAAILISPTIGMEPEALQVLEEAGLGDIPLIGGSAAGPDGQTIYHDAAVGSGVGFALIYTELPVGYAFEGGYEVLDKYSGVVTRTDGRKIVEIDGKPAFEVYDRWMNGEVSEFLESDHEQSEFRDFLSLHPLARLRKLPDGKTYTILSHPWAPNKSLITSGLTTTTDIKEGERVYLSYGTWEILLNRIGALPEKAIARAHSDQAVPVSFGLGYFCGGVLGTIPEENRKFIPRLISRSIGDAPYLGSVTWGEQGQLPGIGNQHCNLTVGFLVVGGPDQ